MFNPCRCCGSGIFFSPGLGYDGKGGPTLCYTCKMRDEKCLHNMKEHLGVWHYSTPHLPDGVCDCPEGR